MKAARYRKCAGHRVSGYWKGYPCGAAALYKKNGKWWCKNHLPIDEPREVMRGEKG